MYFAHGILFHFTLLDQRLQAFIDLLRLFLHSGDQITISVLHQFEHEIITDDIAQRGVADIDDAGGEDQIEHLGRCLIARPLGLQTDIIIGRNDVMIRTIIEDLQQISRSIEFGIRRRHNNREIVTDTGSVIFLRFVELRIRDDAEIGIHTAHGFNEEERHINE